MSDTERTIPEPPKRSRGNAGRAALKAGIASIPVVGAAGAELFGYLVAEPYQKRWEAWAQGVGDALGALRDQDRIDPEALREDPAFQDTVISITQAAVRTSDEDKRAALRNAILNTALPNPPGSAQREMFVRFVEELAPLHLRILDLFNGPRRWLSAHGKLHIGERPEIGSLHDLLVLAYPDLREERDACDQCWADLYTNGLVSRERLTGPTVGRGPLADLTTHRGKEFLRFIREPGTITT